MLSGHVSKWRKAALVDFNYSEKNISTFMKWMYGRATNAIHLFCLANRQRLMVVCCDELSETIAQTRDARVCMRDRQFVPRVQIIGSIALGLMCVCFCVQPNRMRVRILSIYIFFISSFSFAWDSSACTEWQMFVSLFLVSIPLVRQQRRRWRRRPYTCSMFIEVTRIHYTLYNVYRCDSSHFIQHIYDTPFSLYFRGEIRGENEFANIVLNFVYVITKNRRDAEIT